MAKVGSGAAYSQLKRVGSEGIDVGLANADRAAQTNRQQAEISAKKAAANELREERVLKGLELSDEDFIATATGNEGRDDLIRTAVTSGIERSNQILEEAAEAARNGDYALAAKLKNQQVEIVGSFKTLNNDEVLMKEKMDGYVKAYEKGEIIDGAWAAMIDALNSGKGVAYMDENNKYRIKVPVMDENREIVYNEDGSPKTLDKSVSEMARGIDAPYKMEEAYGENGMINKFLTTIGKRKKDELSGDYRTTSQVWDDKSEKALENYISSVMKNDKEMYKWLYRANSEEKFKDFSDSDKKDVEKFIRDGVMAAYGEETTTTERKRTVTEQNAQDAANRAVTMRGQDITQQNNEAGQDVALERLALDWYKAQNPTDKKSAKDVTVEEKTKATVIKFYEMAQEIAKLDPNAREERVQEILDESGLGLVIGGDLDDWMGFGATEYTYDGSTAVQIKDVFANVKGMAIKAGVDMDRINILEVIKEWEDKQNGVEPSADSKTTSSSSTSSSSNRGEAPPEKGSAARKKDGVKPSAADLIEKYGTSN